MRTDDDLIRDLERAFRDDTADLRYTGRIPTPRGRVIPVTPLVVAAAATAVLVPQLGSGPQAAAPGPGPAPSAPTSTTAAVRPTPEAEPRLVTDTIELAGLTVSYQRERGDAPASMYVALGARPPADARQVTDLAPSESAWIRRAWVGTDPVSGHAALWVHTDGEDQISRFAMFWSPGLNVEDFERSLREGE